MKKICVILPMRGGSKGLPDKHLQKLNGKSLAKLTCQTVKEELEDKVNLIISTDDLGIAKECSEFADIVDIRPSHLGNDYVSIEEVLKYNALKHELQSNYGMYLSACDVSRPKGLLKYTYETYFNNSYDSLFWGEYTHKKYWETKINPPKIVEGIEKNYKPRQKDSDSRVLIEHTGLCLITKIEYWKKGLRHGGIRKIIELPENYRHCDIHSKIDLKMAEIYLNSQINFDFNNLYS